MTPIPSTTYNNCLRHSPVASGSCSVAELMKSTPQSASTTAAPAITQLNERYQARSTRR